MDGVKMGKMKPLARFPIITTNRVEEAEFRLSQSITDLQITRVDDRRCFQLKMNAVNFGWASLIYNRFGTETKLKTGMDIDYAIFVAGAGVPSTFYVDNEPHLVSPQKGVIVAPAKQVQIGRPRNSELIILRVALSDLWGHYEKLTNRHHRGSLIFDRTVNVFKGPGAMLKGLMNYLADGLNYDDSMLKIPSLRKSYDDMLMTALLSLPHNKRDELYKDHSNMIAPGLVHRAEDYMKAHLREPVNISDLIRICDCSRSVLFSAFRNARGYTPMEFLTEQRLHNAREQILKSNYDASIASIAWDCGFISHSWFSQVYRKRFGERPSETLRKGR
jgi:AraC-like DNA-binding protein